MENNLYISTIGYSFGLIRYVFIGSQVTERFYLVKLSRIVYVYEKHLTHQKVGLFYYFKAVGDILSPLSLRRYVKPIEQRSTLN